MPRYFFHMHDGGSFTDTTGQELADEQAVRREAMSALPDIARDAIPKDGDKQGYMILVTDEDGAPVYSATLSYAGIWLRPQQASVVKLRPVEAGPAAAPSAGEEDRSPSTIRQREEYMPE